MELFAVKGDKYSTSFFSFVLKGPPSGLWGFPSSRCGNWDLWSSLHPFFSIIPAPHTFPDLSYLTSWFTLHHPSSFPLYTPALFIFPVEKEIQSWVCSGQPSSSLYVSRCHQLHMDSVDRHVIVVSMLNMCRVFFLSLLPNVQCNNYLHNIYMVSAIVSHPEMVSSTQAVV